MFSVKSMWSTLLDQGQNGQSEEEADLYQCPLVSWWKCIQKQPAFLNKDPVFWWEKLNMNLFSFLENFPLMSPGFIAGFNREMKFLMLVFYL